MNNPNNVSDANSAETERKMFPFIVEFVKFTAGFAVIIAVALITLHIASAAL